MQIIALMSQSCATEDAGTSPNSSASTQGRFGSLLRSIRASKGLSQQVVAEHSNIAATYLCAIERDKRPAPEQPVVLRLSEALSLSASETKALVEEAARSRRLWSTQKLKARLLADVQPIESPSSAQPELARLIHEAERVADQGQFKVVITFELAKASVSQIHMHLLPQATTPA